MAKSYNLDYKPGEDALQYYKRLAKVADQRLVRLEQLSTQKGYENVTAYAYARAQYDIGRYTEGKHRFNTKPPLNSDGTVNTKMLNEKIADIKTFLSSASSTKAGITTVYEKRAKTINKKYGTQYTWQDLADLFKSGDFEKFYNKWDSDTIMKALAKIKRAESKVLGEIDKNAKVNSSDQAVTDVALSMLRQKGTSLYKGYSSDVLKAMRTAIKSEEI